MKKFSNFEKSYIFESGADYIKDKIDINQLIYLLKSAFCEEMNAWYQYIIIAPFLLGNERSNIVKDYLENAKEELENHGYWLLERINQLGGSFNDIESPALWDVMAMHKYIKPYSSTTYASVSLMIAAEKGAIETYEKLEAFTRDKDVVTNSKVKEILADEQNHLQEMEDFLKDIS